MNQKLFVCIGEKSTRPCGWRDTKESIENSDNKTKRQVQDYKTCPECNLSVNSAQIQENESIEEVAKKERDTAWH